MDRATGVTVLRAVLGESLPLDEPRQLELTLEVSFWARAVVQTRLRPSQHADYDRWQAVVKSLVEEAKALGEFPAGLDADAAATQLVTFVDGLGVDALLYPERFPPAVVHALRSTTPDVGRGASEPPAATNEPRSRTQPAVRDSLDLTTASPRERRRRQEGWR